MMSELFGGGKDHSTQTKVNKAASTKPREATSLDQSPDKTQNLEGDQESFSVL